MRLDKYLKVSRIIKRRTLSKEMAGSERVLVNGKVAKPSHQLKIGDLITAEFGRRRLEVEVLMLKEHVLKDESHLMYRRRLEVEVLMLKEHVLKDESHLMYRLVKDEKIEA